MWFRLVLLCHFLLIYNSRNFICGLDFSSWISLRVSTTVEILYVVQTLSKPESNIYLQQQKFYMWFRLKQSVDQRGHLQQQKFYMWFRPLTRKLQNLSTTVEILYVVQTKDVWLDISNLQQQKFYMWFRLSIVPSWLKSTTVEILYVVQTKYVVVPEFIYNSRNFICGLDVFHIHVLIISTTVEILYVVQTKQRSGRGYSSTTVEILYVVQTRTATICLLYLQQQKFYMWFRQIIFFIEKVYIYNSRNFICGLDIRHHRKRAQSTTVEILYVVQTTTKPDAMLDLQQQKFYMWFRRTMMCQTLCQNLQQQKFYMWFRH